MAKSIASTHCPVCGTPYVTVRPTGFPYYCPASGFRGDALMTREPTDRFRCDGCKIDFRVAEDGTRRVLHEDGTAVVISYVQAYRAKERWARTLPRHVS